MTDEEFKKIKDEYKRVKDLLQEQKELREELETRKDYFRNLQELAWRLEAIDDELFGIYDENDIYQHLSDSTDFVYGEYLCGKDKKLYFFYGFVKEDKAHGEKWHNEKYLAYVPRDTKFNLFNKYYAMYWGLSGRESVIVPINKMKEFEKNNYVIDIGEDINIPYANSYEYNAIRQCNGIEDSRGSNIQSAYDKYRLELFKYFAQSDTEEEAIKKLLVYSKKENTLK